MLVNEEEGALCKHVLEIALPREGLRVLAAVEGAGGWQRDSLTTFLTWLLFSLLAICAVGGCLSAGLGSGRSQSSLSGIRGKR